MRRRLSDVVPWTTVPYSRSRRALVTVGKIVSFPMAPFMLLEPGGAPAPDDPDVRYNPEREMGMLIITEDAGREMCGYAVGIDHELVVRGDSAGVRWRDPDARWMDLSKTTQEEPFDPSEAALLGASPSGRWRFRERKAVHQEWSVTFSWRSREFRTTGPWILIAHLGCLAGWPEPV